MALGDLLEANYDAEWQGFLFGSRVGLDLLWSDTDGLAGLDLPEWRNSDQPADGDGDMPGAERYEARIIDARGVQVFGRDTLDDLRDAMLRRTDDDSGIAFRHMGPHPSIDKLAWVRPRAMRYVENQQSAINEAFVVDLTWKATDPRLYSLTETTTNYASATTHTIPNAGNVTAPFRLEVDGPCTGPRIRRADDSSLLVDFDGLTIPSGKTLVYSVRKRYALLDGVSKIGYAIDAASRPASWWGIPPGGEGVAFAVDSGSTVARIYSRSAWL